MMLARTLPTITLVPEINVYECTQCNLSFTTEDHLSISGTAVP